MHERRMTRRRHPNFQRKQHRTQRICDFFLLWPFRFGTKRHFVPPSPIISQLIGRTTVAKAANKFIINGESDTNPNPLFLLTRGEFSRHRLKKWVRFSINQARTHRLMRLRPYSWGHGVPKMFVGNCAETLHCLPH